MRQIIKFGFILGLVVSSSAFSADPVEGVYLGFQFHGSYATSSPSDIILPPSLVVPGFPTTGRIKLSPIGGGGGASLGYKIFNFRLEGEGLVNINTYSELTVGSCTLISPNVLSPQNTAFCPTLFNNAGLGFKGNTVGVYGFFNVFYDFLLSSDPDVNYYPYVGVGVGGVLNLNHVEFKTNKQCLAQGVCNNNYIDITTTTSNGGFAVQGILGFGYYLDDFATMGLDFRYISTISTNNNATNSSNSSKTFGIATLNVVFNFALEKAPGST